jgi:putative FmdB family regulatory protein
MPIYEYQCQKCHHHFEEIQKVSDAPIACCPKCKGTVSRLISQTSFALKGEGWYKDGYAKLAPKKEDTGKSAEKSAESKPAAPKPPSTPTTKGE